MLLTKQEQNELDALTARDKELRQSRRPNRSELNEINKRVTFLVDRAERRELSSPNFDLLSPKFKGPVEEIYRTLLDAHSLSDPHARETASQGNETEWIRSLFDDVHVSIADVMNELARKCRELESI